MTFVCPFRSLAVGHQYSSLGTQPILCGSIPGLVPKQLRFCRNYVEIMPSVAEGVKIGIQECQHQFRGRRWNCTTVNDNLAIFGPVLDKGNEGKICAFCYCCCFCCCCLCHRCCCAEIHSCKEPDSVLQAQVRQGSTHPCRGRKRSTGQLKTPLSSIWQATSFVVAFQESCKGSVYQSPAWVGLVKIKQKEKVDPIKQQHKKHFWLELSITSTDIY